MVVALLSREGSVSAVRLPAATVCGAAAPGSGLRLTAVPVEVRGLADLPSCVGQSLAYMPAADLFVASLRRVAGEGAGWLISGRPVSDERLLAAVTLVSQPTDEVRYEPARQTNKLESCLACLGSCSLLRGAAMCSQVIHVGTLRRFA